MTHIYQAATNETERAKWRQQADAAAKHIKNVKDWGALTVFVPAFVFDDGVVKLTLEVAVIQRLPEQAIADRIFDAVLEKVATDHRAAGESADAQLRGAPGMECGHAAAQGAEPSAGLATEHAPAAAAVVTYSKQNDPTNWDVDAPDRCIRRLPPAFTEQCQSQATGGVRLKLFAHKRFQKRYGRRSMLELLLHLPVCAGCFAQMTPDQVIAEGLQAGQWGAASKEAQRRNAGILPIREESEIEHVPYADAEYTALRAHIAKCHPEVLKT
jgi:hypothetical protein